MKLSLCLTIGLLAQAAAHDTTRNRATAMRVKSGSLRRGRKNIISILQCPVAQTCADPCKDAESGNPLCDESEECLTKVSMFELNGIKCPGCAVFDRCEKEEPVVCPVPRCMDPCTDYSSGWEEATPRCAKGEKCLTKPGFFKSGDQKCPGCSVFDKCEAEVVVDIPICPMIACIDPCSVCEEGEKCITKQSHAESGCPVCPVFEKCEKEEPVLTCGKIACQDPCLGRSSGSDKPQPLCGDEERCLTTPSYMKNGCPACSVFDRCEPIPTEQLPVPKICPMVACLADPCQLEECPEGTVCLTKPSYFDHDGVRCPGCSVFDKCDKLPEIEIEPNPLPCPMPGCLDACMDYEKGWDDATPKCKDGYECVTKMSYFDNGGGEKCPGCPEFDRCEQIVSWQPREEIKLSAP